MQHEALVHPEDFGGPDIVAGPIGQSRPGQDAPYKAYQLGAAYDEMFAPDGTVRGPYASLNSRISTLPLDELNRRQQACEQSFLHQGITFTVYNDNRATERIIPTDLLPRIVTAAEWERIERGLTQRIMALNLFLREIYSDGRVLKDGVVPRAMIAIARAWGVPARYVSGYMYHRGSKDRSQADATHAWVEAYLPSLGWVGFDPTNNIPAGERHVRAAVGRDYADAPPTRGTFKGTSDSELSIAVGIEPTQAPVRHEDFLKVARPMASPATVSMPERIYAYQQQQQQQQ